MMNMRWIIVVATLAGAPAAAWAADALHPYSNIDHRVDAGNDTGDSRVAALNQAQLDIATAGGRARWVPGMATIYPGHRMPPPGYAQPYPGYPTPPPAYGWPMPGGY